MKKGLVIVLVALFTSMAFAPCINANFSNTSVENKLINISVEIYGIDGVQEKIIQMSEQDAFELEVIFDDMKLRLENVNTKQETIDIFNEVVVSLNELELLPKDISVKEAQQLVTDGNHEAITLNKINDKARLYNSEDVNCNFNCFIVGKTSDLYTEFFKPWWPIWLTRIKFIKTLVNGIISFGIEVLYYDNKHVFYPASGWVWTNGSNGVKTWESDILWGNLGTHYEIFYIEPTTWNEYWYYKGATGFTGISLRTPPNAHFFGIASHVNIVTEFPGKNPPIEIQNSHISEHSSLLFWRLLEQFPLLQKLLQNLGI